MSKRKLKLLVVALSSLAIPGCASQPVVQLIKPDCEIPPIPILPPVHSSELESLSDDTFWRLMERERITADWAFEMKAVLQAVCAE